MTDAADRATASVAMDDAERDRTLSGRRAAHEAVVARMAAEGIEGRSCKDCGEAIPLKRLQAEPAATRCTFCQDQAEQEGRA